MGASFLLLLLLLFLALVLGIWIGWMLSRYFRSRHPVPPPPPPPPCGYKIPDQLNEAGLTAQLSVRLVGTPADGVPTPAGLAPSSVIWVDHGSEVLVHLDSTAVRILDRTIIVSVDLETDQTGRTPLICTFALSGAGELGGLVAATDDLPRGNGLLASCWGKHLQTAVWSSLIGLANDHAGERDLAPRALSASPGSLQLGAGSALTTASSPGAAE